MIDRSGDFSLSLPSHSFAQLCERFFLVFCFCARNPVPVLGLRSISSMTVTGSFIIVLLRSVAPSSWPPAWAPMWTWRCWRPPRASRRASSRRRCRLAPTGLSSSAYALATTRFVDPSILPLFRPVSCVFGSFFLAARCKPRNLPVQFCHDHVRAAAYGLLDEAERRRLHLRIGQTMLARADLRRLLAERPAVNFSG